MSSRIFVFALAGVGLSLALMPLISLGSFAAAMPDATFDAGEDALIAAKFGEARRIYAAAAASPAQPPKDRAAALRQLGVMSWRLYADAASAERYFAEALRMDAGLSSTHAELARFLTTTHRFDEAATAAEAAVATASNNAERQTAALSYARNVTNKLNGVSIGRQTGADARQLKRARLLLQPFSNAPPLPLELSEALLAVALRLDDGPLALLAWRSYAREGAEEGPWASAARRLSNVLPRWHTGAMTAQLRAEIFEGLRTSQFFDLAALIATDDRLEGSVEFSKTPRVVEVVAYARALAEMRAATDAYYCDVANRNGIVGAWQKSLFAAGEKLWPHLDFQGARPAFSRRGLDTELRARFGALVNLGETGGVPDLHFGHIFIDDPHAIEQYGHKATIRRIAIDRIVSNGYESWIWDGRQAHGGWGDADRVIQVRPGYVDGALRIWDQVTDSTLRAEAEDRIGRLTADDDKLAVGNVVIFLPGLASRLDWQGRNAIRDRLMAQGLSGQELKRRFVIDFNRIGLDSNFFAHEGRHVLDKQAFGDQLESEELEFRAKLSEIAFSEQPRFSFGPIFNADIMDAQSPHGRANRRIMSGLIAWMDAHRPAIANLDPARALLPQFDKLSDEQMRAAMRSMDSWASKP